MLPEVVLQELSEAVLDYNNSGLSLLELPHRGKLFNNILEEAAALVRELCELNEDYHICWIQGGRLQFSMIPMNLLAPDGTAGYIDSGHWAAEAMHYATIYGKALPLSSSRAQQYRRLPPWPEPVDKSLAYLHFTTNNTIYGTQWRDIPVSEIPLVADMSSDILSERRAYRHCALFYAVAQKNIGAAGVTLVVLHKDLLLRGVRKLPPVLDYSAYVQYNSVVNTPPVSAIYTSLLMLRWTKQKSIAILEEENKKKAAMLYEEINRNPLFVPVVDTEDHRSRMNICFRGINIAIDDGFTDFCKQHNITGINGHRLTGGLRASLYNAVPLSQVALLIQVMQEFEQQNQKN